MHACLSGHSGLPSSCLSNQVTSTHVRRIGVCRAHWGLQIQHSWSAGSVCFRPIVVELKRVAKVIPYFRNLNARQQWRHIGCVLITQVFWAILAVCMHGRVFARTSTTDPYLTINLFENNLRERRSWFWSAAGLALCMYDFFTSWSRIPSWLLCEFIARTLSTCWLHTEKPRCFETNHSQNFAILP